MAFQFHEASDLPESRHDGVAGIPEESRRQFDRLMKDDDLPSEIAYYKELPAGYEEADVQIQDGRKEAVDDVALAEQNDGQDERMSKAVDSGQIRTILEDRDAGHASGQLTVESLGQNSGRSETVAKTLDFCRGETAFVQEQRETIDEWEKKEMVSREAAVKEVEPDLASGCPIEGHNGHWEGERGNSVWIPDGNYVPTRYNPKEWSWKQIKETYGIDGIEYRDGQPVFSKIAKAEVKIDDFSDDRASNFAQADEQAAMQRGCTPREVRRWRQEHGYTWHECRDCETIQKVPSAVHNNMDHSGGVSEYKRRNGGNLV